MILLISTPNKNEVYSIDGKPIQTTLVLSIESVVEDLSATSTN